MTGWTTHEVAGKPVDDFFHIVNARTRKKAGNPMARAIQDGVIVGLANDTVLIARDGREYQIADSCAPITDTNGNVIGTVLVFRDVTEDYRHQEALRESELRFQSMLSVVPDMISIHDPDMNILYSNWNGFGSVPEEKRILKTKCYRTYRGYNCLCPDCQAIKVIETCKPFHAEKQLPDGKWVDLRIIPILDEKGKVMFFMEWVKDITASKLAEENLERAKNRPKPPIRPRAVFWQI